MQSNKRVLVWTLILFISTLSWMVFEKLMGWHGVRISDHATYSIFYDALFILVFYLAFRANKQQSDHLSWKDGFFFGLKITTLMALLSPLTQTIIHRIISPEFFPNIIDFAVENNILSRSEATERFNLTTYMVQNAIGTSILGLLTTCTMALIMRKR